MSKRDQAELHAVTLVEKVRRRMETVAPGVESTISHIVRGGLAGQPEKAVEAIMTVVDAAIKVSYRTGYCDGAISGFEDGLDFLERNGAEVPLGTRGIVKTRWGSVDAFSEREDA